MGQDHFKNNYSLKINMKIYDQHVHSYYSFDSEQTIEEYIEKALDLGLSNFVLTDHLDLNYISTGKDLDFNIENQHKELDKLQGIYPQIQILKGVEIGYVKTEIDRIKKILNDHKFDLINYSIHEDGKIDYYYKDKFLENGIKNVLNHYFDNIIEALDAGIDFDVLCHFDYGFKTAYLIDKTQQISNYEDKIIPIFKRIIEMDKCLEINVKVQSFINDEHTNYVLNLYSRLGGKNITLSSDAHEVNCFYEQFDHYLGLIKKAGFDHLNYFVNRVRFDCKI